MALYVRLKEGNKCEDIVKSIQEKYKSHERICGEMVWTDECGDLTILTEGEDYWGNSAYSEKPGNAWMRLNTDKRNRAINCGIIGRKDKKMLTYTYAQYHGVLLAIFLTYYDEKIENIRITPLPDKEYDFCNV